MGRRPGYKKEWYKNNPDKMQKEHRQRNLRKYSMSEDEYSALLISQNGVCAICKKICLLRKNLCIDHNHTTGENRGLLCHNCNCGLGQFKDNSTLLRNATEYLEKYEIS